MRVDDLGRAVALVGARLRGDVDGERVLLGDCGEDLPLVEGLLLVAELSLTVMAQRDGVSREQAAETTAVLLRSLAGGGG
ncbi:hypothetical protein [Streptacidiphilus carbonis]|uniref:hypothetical protein n=1 Tax=Streptacidiphilus carbonis TaxID=105422 RepID=UPI0005A64762|nr:hypothetical protein [Streptacidiphilus carbonis]